MILKLMFPSIGIRSVFVFTLSGCNFGQINIEYHQSTDVYIPDRSNEKDVILTLPQTRGRWLPRD